jgi:hypothetical protein
MRAIRQRLRRRGRRDVVLFMDETDVLLFPPLRAGWAPRGTSVAVSLCGANAKRVIYGGLNPRTGHRILFFRRSQCAGDFQVFLREARAQYPGRRIWLLLDSDRSHTAQASQRLAAALEIRLVWLPVRCPELNAVDHLWRDAKQQVCANHQEPDILVLVAKFLAHLRSLSPRAALEKAGVLAPHFWLRGVLSRNFWRPT